MKFNYEWAIAYIRSFIMGDPILHARKQLQSAVQHMARQTAELNYERSLAAFYDDQARNLDPHLFWWEFAQAKQCWHEHTLNGELEHRRLDAAEARYTAAEQRLATLMGWTAPPDVQRAPEPGTPEWKEYWGSGTYGPREMSVKEAVDLLSGRPGYTSGVPPLGCDCGADLGLHSISCPMHSRNQPFERDH